MRGTPLVLSLVAGSCFVAAFVQPLVCSDFSLEHVPYLNEAEEVIDAPCVNLISTVRESIPPVPIPFTSVTAELDELLDAIPSTDANDVWAKAIAGCLGTIDTRLQDTAWNLMDEKLGLIRDPLTEHYIGWRVCTAEVEAGAETSQLGNCCHNEKSPLQTCMKWWVADRGGVPIGDQYLLGIIHGLFESGDILLGFMIVLFSVFFPLLKVGSCLYLSLRPAAERSMRFLRISSKWSMTDVFLVALLITFFKADSFNFRFEAESGLYFFAAGALLSTITVLVLERTFGPREAGRDNKR